MDDDDEMSVFRERRDTIEMDSAWIQEPNLHDLREISFGKPMDSVSVLVEQARTEISGVLEQGMTSNYEKEHFSGQRLEFPPMGVDGFNDEHGSERIEIDSAWIVQEPDLQDLGEISLGKSMDSVSVLSAEAQGEVFELPRAEISGCLEEGTTSSYLKEQFSDRKVKFPSMVNDGFDDEHGRKRIKTDSAWVVQDPGLQDLGEISLGKSMGSVSVLAAEAHGEIVEQVRTEISKNLGTVFEKEQFSRQKVEDVEQFSNDGDLRIPQKHLPAKEEGSMMKVEKEGLAAPEERANIYNVPSVDDMMSENDVMEQENSLLEKEGNEVKIADYEQGTKSHFTCVLPSVQSEFQGEDSGFLLSAVDRPIEKDANERKLVIDEMLPQIEGIWGFNDEKVQPFVAPVMPCPSTSMVAEGEISSDYSVGKMAVIPTIKVDVENLRVNSIEENAVESLEIPVIADLKPMMGSKIKTSNSMEVEPTPEILENKDKMADQVISCSEGSVAPLSSSGDFIDEDQELCGSTTEGQLINKSILEDGSRKAGKRRGRPSRTQASKALAKKKEEEDVCFICFDGGNLVVCDRRGCPKVYHPSCVNRDEAFFRSKGKWNCGWHICSVCEKAAHYMCFTCTYSLCKSCIKDSQFVCIRGNKGLCDTCRSTVSLIETNKREGKGVGGVNFDDKGSWEYLFKDYWLDLKRKLSITSEEVSKAKNPSKGSLVLSEDKEDEPYDANEDQDSSSDSSSGRLKRSKSAKKKVKKSPKTPASEAQQITESIQLPDTPDSEWASHELLEFVAPMRNGDKSVMCQFDVHTLLLDYIKQNNLRDPRRKSQIVCDAQLQTLFGKARVGHFEMLKLLESHFLVKEPSQTATEDNQETVLDPEANQIDNEGNSNSAATGSDKKQKLSKKKGKGEIQNNVNDYAAIDVHNINLLYIRRNLMEELLGDPEFREKVVGSFVRIRISGSGMRKDMYRLVPIIGTSRVENKYKCGKKTTDISLEILNLSKTEVVSIDSISNQEFTEEECIRLRQSMKFGLINRLTVGNIQEKALALQSVRINESLENEKQRLSHLRDRASEKGRRKELRECVEKLQRLNSSEERARRLNEMPVIHSDPKMDPTYVSDEEEIGHKRPESTSRTRDSSFSNRRRESMPPKKAVPPPLDTFTDPHRGSGSYHSDVNGVSTPSHLKEKLFLSPVATDQSFPSSAESKSPKTPLAVNENEKIWHYKDPSGKMQGPFSMTQLRKWNTTGYFPASLRIWRASEKEEESILLTDALLGKFQRDFSSPNIKNSHQSPSIQVNARSHSNLASDSWSPTPNAQRAKYDEQPNIESQRSSYEQHQGYNFASEQRGEWSMPSPTPTVEPSRYDPGKKPDQGISQDTTANQGPPSVASVPQGNHSAGWGTASQANPSETMAWGPPPPPPPLPPPPPGNPNMNNLIWMAQAQAQAQAQAYSGWAASAQAQVAAAGWLPPPPAAMPQVPNWGLPNQQGVPNPNSGWGMPSSDGNSGHSAGWGAHQKNDDLNICRFFQQGHCKKGDSCNYRHYR